MNVNLIFLIIFFLCCLFQNNINAAIQSYKFVDLGVQESDRSEAFCINDKNEVLGAYYIKGEKNTFIWSQENGMRVIDFPKNATPVKMNSLGQVIGYFPRLSNNESDHFFVWDEINGVVDIAFNSESIEIGAYTVLKDINDNGQIIGVFHKNNMHGSFIWENGLIKVLDGLYGELGLPSNKNVAFSINNKGDIVGYSSKTLFHKGKVYRTQSLAVVWKASHNWKISEIFPYDESNTIALRINDFGHVIFEKSDPFGHHYISGGMKLLFDIDSNQLIPFAKKQIINNGNAIKYLYTKNVNGVDSDNSKGLSLYEILPSSEAQISHIGFNDVKDFDGIWKQIHTINSANNLLWAVGTGRNIYGEYQAILLAPIIK